MYFPSLAQVVKLKQIKGALLAEHFYLHWSDTCHYLMEYEAHPKQLKHSTKQLIADFKHSGAKYPYNVLKAEAMHHLLKRFQRYILPTLDLSNSTLVPIPSSKAKDDPRHDDRMIKLLQMGCYKHEADIQELIMNKNSLPASHRQKENRPNPNTLFNNYAIDPSRTENIKANIILFDDLITSGAHYRAAHRLLSKSFGSKVTIRGIFLARRKL